jgi:hypothetical protein
LFPLVTLIGLPAALSQVGVPVVGLVLQHVPGAQVCAATGLRTASHASAAASSIFLFIEPSADVLLKREGRMLRAQVAKIGLDARAYTFI